MLVSKKWGSYNSRRYGKPWAARIKAFDGRPELDFFSYPYNGDDNGGELVFNAEPGEIVKIGQKDFRGNGTKNDFYKVTEAGELELIESPVEARKLWTEWKNRQ